MVIGDWVSQWHPAGTSFAGITSRANALGSKHFRLKIRGIPERSIHLDSPRSTRYSFLDLQYGLRKRNLTSTYEEDIRIFSRKNTIPAITDEARELHAEVFVMDLHVDSFLLAHQFGYDFLARHRAFLPFGAIGRHVDLPRMLEGGVDGAAFGVVVNPLSLPGRAWQSAKAQIELFHHACRRSKKRLRLARTAEDALAAKRDACCCGFSGLEGCHVLGEDLGNLEEAYRLGVRYITLAHFSSNRAVACAKGWGADPRRGLSPWGRELVAEMNRLGIMVDLAHVNRRGFLEAAAASEKPCLVSHTGLAGVHPLWRNIDDEQIKAIADGGGVIGIIFAPQFLCGRLKAGAEAVFSHIDYIVTRFGEDFVGLGSDFDGYILSTPSNLRDASMTPVLTDIMLRRGYSAERIKKILGGNALRVWAS